MFVFELESRRGKDLRKSIHLPISVHCIALVIWKASTNSCLRHPTSVFVALLADLSALVKPKRLLTLCWRS